MNDKPVAFTEQAARKVAETVRTVQSGKGQWNNQPGSRPQQGGKIGDGLFLGKTTQDIAPNTFGGFRFTRGGRGSESVYGDSYSGYWFAESAADDLPANTLIFVYWVPNSESSESGWVITPVLCPE